LSRADPIEVVPSFPALLAPWSIFAIPAFVVRRSLHGRDTGNNVRWKHYNNLGRVEKEKIRATIPEYE